MHDISSPLAVTQGMLDIVLTNLTDGSVVNGADLEKLKKAAAALTRVIEHVKKNQELIRLIA